VLIGEQSLDQIRMLGKVRLLEVEVAAGSQPKERLLLDFLNAHDAASGQVYDGGDDVGHVSFLVHQSARQARRKVGGWLREILCYQSHGDVPSPRVPKQVDAHDSADHDQ